MLRVATFNVNGVRARQDLLSAWLEGSGCQLAALQEIKSQEQDFPQQVFAKNYHIYIAGQKSFNGVALLCRQKPDEVVENLPAMESLGARFLAARFGGLWVLNTYVPQGRAPESPAFQDKLNFLHAVGEYIKALAAPQLIWLGDINVAPGDLDVHDPIKLQGQIGFHPLEHQMLSHVMSECRLYDLFREKNPGIKEFSFWDYRVPNGFKRNLGWRIDHLLVTAALREACLACWIERDLRGAEKPSDHTPVLADFDLG
jgi:exodeoxyribonuclease-3